MPENYKTDWMVNSDLNLLSSFITTTLAMPFFLCGAPENRAEVSELVSSNVFGVKQMPWRFDGKGSRYVDGEAKLQKHAVRCNATNSNARSKPRSKPANWEDVKREAAGPVSMGGDGGGGWVFGGTLFLT